MGIKYLGISAAVVAGILIFSALMATAHVGPDVQISSLEITHVCDERGVCCYESSRGLSCVATSIEVVLLPGNVQDDESQGNTTTSGEIGSRTLEKGVLRELNGAFVQVH